MRSSRGEIKIYEILEKNNVIFKEEVEFPGLKAPSGKPLRFDFAVYDDEGELDFLIEYQGKQHYEPVAKFGGNRGLYQQRYNDRLKRRFCALKGITLVEVPYTDEHIVSYDYIYKKAGY